MRFAVVIGHRRDRQGARALSGVHEWEWNIPLGARLCGELEAAGQEADLLFRPNTSSGAMNKLVERINHDTYDAVVSLHFNAGAGGAGGHLMLHYPGSRNGEALAKACSRAHNEAFPGIRDRGLWATKVNGSGTELYILTKVRCPSMIVESHFGDSPDHEYCTPRRDLLAVKLAGQLVELAKRADSGAEW